MSDRRWIVRSKVLEQLGFKDYQTYLESDIWIAIRAKVLCRDNDICRRCGKPADHIHHISYRPSVMKGDELDGMISLCKICHGRLEFRKDGGRRSDNEIKSVTAQFWPELRHVIYKKSSCIAETSKKKKHIDIYNSKYSDKELVHAYLKDKGLNKKKAKRIEKELRAKANARYREEELRRVAARAEKGLPPR